MILIQSSAKITNSQDVDIGWCLHQKHSMLAVIRVYAFRRYQHRAVLFSLSSPWQCSFKMHFLFGNILFHLLHISNLIRNGKIVKCFPFTKKSNTYHNQNFSSLIKIQKISNVTKMFQLCLMSFTLRKFFKAECVNTQLYCECHKLVVATINIIQLIKQALQLFC